MLVYNRKIAHVCKEFGIEIERVVNKSKGKRESKQADADADDVDDDGDEGEDEDDDPVGVISFEIKKFLYGDISVEIETIDELERPIKGNPCSCLSVCCVVRGISCPA